MFKLLTLLFAGSTMTVISPLPGIGAGVTGGVGCVGLLKSMHQDEPK